MCGIAGIISSEINTHHENAMKAMLKAQHHRGPDHNGYKNLSSKLIFGHNRLSIIDLGDQSNQPFESSCGRYHLIFNGEIYNYLELKDQLHYNLQTNSDTEVLLAACIEWGHKALNKLNGMFAFAFYDSKTKELLLARDRFGVKPFYYAINNDTFYFASEIKSLHAAGIKKLPNEKVWAAYLSKGRYQLANETFWSYINQIQAGHYATINTESNTSTFEQKQWYDFVGNIKKLHNDSSYTSRNREQHLAEYKKLLEDSIRLRFRSDVPVGFNISGGLDSSTLLGAVHQYKPDSPIEAFTFYCNDERYDELPWVEELISETAKPLNKVLLELSSVPQLAENLQYYQDEPYGGVPTIAYSQIFNEAKKKGIIVLLDGQGMDEAWAGYDYYHSSSDSVVQGTTTSPFRTEVLKEEFVKKAELETYPSPFDDELLNKQYRDLFYTKIPRALRFNDRVSMMHSTELREPFLDYRMVEYAFALPKELKTQDGVVKWALRDLAKKYLNSNLLLAPKRPLQTPQREWLTEDLLDWVEEKIMKLKSHPWFDEKKLEEEWQKFLKSEKDNTFFLWQWLSI